MGRKLPCSEVCTPTSQRKVCRPRSTNGAWPMSSPLERLRFETELDKRPDAPGQQVVIKLVDLRPVVDGLAIFHSHCSQHVVKDRVKTDIAKAEFIHSELELSLAVIPNQRARKIRPNR